MSNAIKENFTVRELTQGIKSKKELSLSVLYDRYAPALLSILITKLPDKPSAEEVLQKVFLNIWCNINYYKPEKGSLFSWMMQIVKHELSAQQAQNKKSDQHIKGTILYFSLRKIFKGKADKEFSN